MAECDKIAELKDGDLLNLFAAERRGLFRLLSLAPCSVRWNYIGYWGEGG
jgi:hypothetical protein